MMTGLYERDGPPSMSPPLMKCPECPSCRWRCHPEMASKMTVWGTMHCNFYEPMSEERSCEHWFAYYDAMGLGVSERFGLTRFDVGSIACCIKCGELSPTTKELRTRLDGWPWPTKEEAEKP